jgi:hypothetical protein
MKVAILSESPADEAALRILVRAVLGTPLEYVTPGLRARGWPSVAQILPAVIRHLHFSTKADGLVVVVDSDDTPVHTAAHDAPGYFHPQCRMCQLRAVFRQSVRRLPPAAGRHRVLRGVGVAVPAIEAWYLCGRDPTVSEEAWSAGLSESRPPYTRRELKERIYGTDRPNLALQTSHALKAVRAHSRDTRRIEYDFPGFAALAADLRTWAATADG